MEMISYLSGDEDSIVMRRSRRKPVVLAVDMPELKRMLTIQVEHNGRIGLAWSEPKRHDEVSDFDLVAQVVNPDEGKTAWFECQGMGIYSTPNPVIQFQHMKKVRGEE